MPNIHNNKCCCGDPCEGGARYAKIKPIMFPDLFMRKNSSGPGGQLSPPQDKISYWVKYAGSCPARKPESKDDDIVIAQTIIPNNDDDEEERVIRIGDTTTRFMTDCGAQANSEDSHVGMYTPGDNERFTVATIGQTSFSGVNISSGWTSGSVRMASGPTSPAFTMWHRNCFTLQDIVTTDPNEPTKNFLTEDEWLALDEFRVVFRSVQLTYTFTDRTDDIVDEDGVHIFNDVVPFKKYDCVPFEYSPALHCVPDQVVGGFRKPNGSVSEEETWVLVYDFKDHYPDQVGVSVGGGAWGASATDEFACETRKGLSGASWPAREYFASAYPMPQDVGQTVPFEVGQRLACPDEGWDVPWPEQEQEFVESNGIPCDDYGSAPGPDCFAAELCHGETDCPENVAFGEMGTVSAYATGSRSVAEENPLRNHLFNVRVIRSSDDNLNPVYAFYKTQGTDFPGQYHIYTGQEAVQIKVLNELFGFSYGFLNFGVGTIGSDNDPNPPTVPGPVFRESGRRDIGGPPWECGCAEETSTLINYGRRMSFTGTATYTGGTTFIQKTPGWQTSNSFSFLDEFKGDDRTLSQPIVSTP